MKTERTPGHHTRRLLDIKDGEQDMKMKSRRMAAVVCLILALLLSGCGSGEMETALTGLDEYYAGVPVETGEYLRALVWACRGTGFDGWQEDCVEKVCARLDECGGVLSNTRSTDYSAVILTLTAAGADARSVNGLDLTQALFDTEFVTRQGLNGSVFALLALDSGGYPAPEGLREALLDEILSRQLADGGFTLSGEQADPDMTAMALQALAGYSDEPAAASAIGRALEALSRIQEKDGAYASFGAVNAESCAQAVLALGALGVPQDDPRFVKNGASALDALLRFRLEDGSFSHEMDGKSSPLATAQAYAALCAADGGKLFVPGK